MKPRIVVVDDEERMATVDILTALIDRVDGPWAGWWSRDVEAERTRKPAQKMASILRAFDITSKDLRMDGRGTLKGYERASFEDAWARYLGPR